MSRLNINGLKTTYGISDSVTGESLAFDSQTTISDEIKKKGEKVDGTFINNIGIEPDENQSGAGIDIRCEEGAQPYIDLHNKFEEGNDYDVRLTMKDSNVTRTGDGQGIFVIEAQGMAYKRGVNDYNLDPIIERKGDMQYGSVRYESGYVEQYLTVRFKSQTDAGFDGIDGVGIIDNSTHIANDAGPAVDTESFLLMEELQPGSPVHVQTTFTPDAGSAPPRGLVCWLDGIITGNESRCHVYVGTFDGTQNFTGTISIVIRGY